jgi:ERI1 exoribonuclease 3
MVENQPKFPQVLQEFDEWMKKEEMLGPNQSLFVTCGDWDLKTMLTNQCANTSLYAPTYFHDWLNVKSAFANSTGVWGRSLTNMLKHFHLEHIGRHHSGIGNETNRCNFCKDNY